ncbi:MAG: hypothetical protein ABI395_05185 [Sphingobium sp.]
MPDDESAEFELSAKAFKFKLPSKLVTRVANQALDVVSPATEALGYLGDIILGQRQITAAKNIVRVRDIIEAESRNSLQTDKRFMIEWFERSSNDVDNELTEEWARLLISHSDNPTSLKRSFITILSAIGSIEVKFLQRAYSCITTDKLDTGLGKLSYYGSQLGEDQIRHNWQTDNGQRLTLSGRIDSDALDRGESDGWIERNYASVILLKSLGLIDIASHADDVDYISAFLTPLGIEFVSACSKKESTE